MGQRSADPVRLEVFHHLLAAVCEESGALLQRSAISPNIRERRDYSCALFDGKGQLVAQAAHIPVHLGSAGGAVKAVREKLCLGPGDVVLLNDPYAGGTHLPDLTMLRPVFLEQEPRRQQVATYYVVNRAHHADIGGSVPGSMGVAADLVAEGLRIPPLKLRRGGKEQEDVLDLILANVRAAEDCRVDLQAQEAALHLAEQRLRALADQQGRATLEAYCGHLMDYSERIVGKVLNGIPRGSYDAEDFMEDDGRGNGPFGLRLRLRLRLGARRSQLLFDFSASDTQAAGPINANPSIVLAACVYALRCLCPRRLPTNEGVFRRLRLRTRQGSLLDPRPPAPVAGGNVETSQRLVDLCLQALAKALPDRIPASSAGTMSNLALGGEDPVTGESYTYYETLPGGAGAGPWGDGSSALQTHMTNTRNTPVEEIEQRYPLRVESLTVRRGSGGRGRHRGGDGLQKDLTLLGEATVSVFSDRQKVGPPGLQGGEAGKTGDVGIYRKGRKGSRCKLPAKGSLTISPGDRLVLRTPGGGGWGSS